MNENDAYSIGQQDAAIAGERISKAQGPHQVEQIIHSFIVHRIEGLIGKDRGRKLLASTEPISGSTTSERIVTLTTKIVSSCKKAMIPEDCYALMLWMCGSAEGGPGFVQHTLQMVPDQSTAHAISSMQRAVIHVRTDLAGFDRHLLTEQKAQLKPAQSRLIDGMLYEAGVSANDGDGERARDKMILVRRTIRRFQVGNSQRSP